VGEGENGEEESKDEKEFKVGESDGKENGEREREEKEDAEGKVEER
jgi:hypothetical protein